MIPNHNRLFAVAFIMYLKGKVMRTADVNVDRFLFNYVVYIGISSRNGKILKNLYINIEVGWSTIYKNNK